MQTSRRDISRSIIDRLSDAVFVIDASGSIRFANARAAALSGVSRDDLIGRSIDDLFPARSDAHWAANDEAHAWVGQRADGERFTADVSVEDFEDGCELVIVRDVSLGVGRARSSIRGLHPVLDRLFVFVAMLATDGTIVDANQPNIDGVEVPLAELLGYRFQDLRSWSSKTGTRQIVTQAVERAAAGESLRFDVEVRFQGRRFPLDLSISPVLDGDGHVGALVVTAGDVTRLVAAEEQVRHRDEQLRDILDNIPAAVYVKDRDGRYTFVNAALASRHGVPRRRFIGKRDVDLHAEGVVAGSLEGDERVLASEAAEEAVERMPGVQGRTQSALRFPLRDAGGVVYGTCGISIDVSDRLDAKQKQEELERKWEQSLRLQSLGRLAGGIAHDFNNLLTVIINYSSLVRSDIEDHVRAGCAAVAHCDRLHEEITAIEAAARRGSALTRQLLIFGDREHSQPTELHVNTVLLDLHDVLHRMIGDGIRLELAMLGALPPVSADASRIEQAVINLAVNARDAMPAGGRLRIETGLVRAGDGSTGVPSELAPGSYVRIAVSDTGLGMDPGVASHAFEPFFTTKPLGHGSGLGLSTVYGIARRAGGAVELETSAGAGTTVSVYLPASAQDPAPYERTTERVLGGETVLIVEDEPTVLEGARRLLEEHGYRVLSAARPTEALSTAVRAESIDVLVADVALPEMSGRRLAQRLVDWMPGLPVVFLSAHPDEAAATEETRELGGDVLHGPILPDALLARVRAAVQDHPVRASA